MSASRRVHRQRLRPERRPDDPVPVLRLPRDPEPLDESPPTAVRRRPVTPPEPEEGTASGQIPRPNLRRTLVDKRRLLANLDEKVVDQLRHVQPDEIRHEDGRYTLTVRAALDEQTAEEFFGEEEDRSEP